MSNKAEQLKEGLEAGNKQTVGTGWFAETETETETEAETAVPEKPKTDRQTRIKEWRKTLEFHPNLKYWLETSSKRIGAPESQIAAYALLMLKEALDSGDDGIRQRLVENEESPRFMYEIDLEDLITQLKERPKRGK